MLPNLGGTDSPPKFRAPHPPWCPPWPPKCYKTTGFRHWERNGLYATFVWQERAHTRDTQIAGMASPKPLCLLGNRPSPSMVSEGTVSNTKLSESFWPFELRGELSEFLSAYYLCVKANSPSLPQNSVSSLFRNSTLETVFHPFPIGLEEKHTPTPSIVAHRNRSDFCALRLRCP